MVSGSAFTVFVGVSTDCPERYEVSDHISHGIGIPYQLPNWNEVAMVSSLFDINEDKERKKELTRTSVIAPDFPTVGLPVIE